MGVVFLCEEGEGWRGEKKNGKSGGSREAGKEDSWG